MSSTDVSSLEIPGDGVLSSSLVLTVNQFCDDIEDAGPGVVGVVRVNGAKHQPRSGDVSIRLVNRWERALRRLERLGKVTIAVAEGKCAGPAFEVLLATDYRLATAGARLILPTSSGQFWPGMGLHRLANQIGVARTRQLLLRTPELSADRAAGLGLLDEITDDVAATLTRTVETLKSVEGAEFAIRRRLLLEAPTTTFDDAIGVHLAACDRTLRRAQPAPAV